MIYTDRYIDTYKQPYTGRDGYRNGYEEISKRYGETYKERDIDRCGEMQGYREEMDILRSIDRCWLIWIDT